MSNLLKVGTNRKLGKQIAAFSLPAVNTCPGRTKLCEGICYATAGCFKWPNVKNSLQRNFKASKQDDFIEQITNQLQRSRTIAAVRIHPAGDFYDPEYIEKWHSIVEGSPGIQFWAYTRSWRLPRFRNVLHKLAKLDNIELWASIDEETKKLGEEPPSWLRKADVVTDWSDKDTQWVRCPNLVNKKIKCRNCQYCFRSQVHKKKHVVFKVH